MPLRPRGRRSIRLPGFDCSAPGAYFITLCTHRRHPILATLVSGSLRPTPAGEIVSVEWHRSAHMRAELLLDAFVVMPDHVHGIVLIRETLPALRDGAFQRQSRSVARGPTPRSLGAFVAGFKAASTVRVNALRHSPGAPVWQRNYYESVVCDVCVLHRIREYIKANPARWIAGM